MKKDIKAFTLAEILVCLMIIGIIAAISISTLRPRKFDDKKQYLMAIKLIENANNVAEQIRQEQTELIPTALFMTKDPGSGYTFTVMDEDGNLANATYIAGLFGDYMKKEGDVVNFCSYSGGCAASNASVKGFKLAGGGAYIGFEKLASIADCPSFYMPQDNKSNTEPTPNVKLDPAKNFDGTTKKCWGKFYIDVDGLDGPNVEGQDFYILGLDEKGVVTTGITPST